MRAVFIAMVCSFSAVASAAAPVRGPQQSAPVEAVVLESISLRSIAGWLKQHGRDGFVGADVADAIGIPRLQSEEVLEARQRGFRSDDVLRIAQIPVDERRDFILFMVQRPDDQVFFYLSTVRDGLQRAFVSIPSKNLVMPLDWIEAEQRFQQEIRYWGDRVGPQ